MRKQVGRLDGHAVGDEEMDQRVRGAYDELCDLQRGEGALGGSRDVDGEGRERIVGVLEQNVSLVPPIREEYENAPSTCGCPS